MQDVVDARRWRARTASPSVMLPRDQLDLLLLDELGDVLLAPGGEVVEDAHPLARADERVARFEPMKPAPPVTR